MLRRSEVFCQLTVFESYEIGSCKTFRAYQQEFNKILPNIPEIELSNYKRLALSTTVTLESIMSYSRDNKNSYIRENSKSFFRDDNKRNVGDTS
jgi:hypothetical protein